MRLTAWQYGASYLTVRHGCRKLNKVFCYMDIQRQDEKRLERFYGEERLRSALAEHHEDFKNFRNMMDKAHILLDKRILSQLAIYEPRTFKGIVELSQKMALEEGRLVAKNSEELGYVQIDSTLFGEPFPSPRKFPKGPSENHRIVPRRLRMEEF